MKAISRFFMAMTVMAFYCICVLQTTYAQGPMLYGLTLYGGNEALGAIIHYDQTSGSVTNDYFFSTVQPGATPTYTELTDGGNGKFYGMTVNGGATNAGVIFEWDPATNIYTKKIDLSSDIGSFPRGSMILYGGKLYGMTNMGGVYNYGVIFEYDPITNTYTDKIDLASNTGSYPNGSLAISGGKFYGMTNAGGLNHAGVIFEWDLATNTYTDKIDLVQSSGAFPQGTLTLNGGIFYGMTLGGGLNNSGVIFQWDPATNTYTKKIDMSNSTGINPYGKLSFFGGEFYGMAQSGGANYSGVIFEWDPATNTYTDKVDLVQSIGRNPFGSLLLNGSKFYGMTTGGGQNDVGVIFEWDPSTNVYVKKIDMASTSGASPYSSLSLANGTFYGMTQRGGSMDNGVIFQWDLPTNAYTKKIDLNINSGSRPYSGLTLFGGKFYGVTYNGGGNNNGVIFQWDPATSTFTKRFDMAQATGINSRCNLAAYSGKLYGTTAYGGTNNGGVIFEWDPATNTYTDKVNLGSTTGYNPFGSLTLYGGKFYGMMYQGGGNGFGDIFEWDPATNVFTKKFDFSGSTGYSAYGALTQNGGKFYGMTYYGGANGLGTVFEWDPSSNTITNQYDLSPSTGYNPCGSLTVCGGALYGLTGSGGANGYGAIIKWDPANNILTTVYSMQVTGGNRPYGTLTLSGGKLYGMTNSGGSNYDGVIFDFDPATNTYTDLYDLTPSAASPYYALFTVLDNCINPTDGGIIASDQSGCGTLDPVLLTSTSGASGYTGNLEYKWQQSTTSGSSGFTDILNSNAAAYQPPSGLTVNTWYKRLARVDCSSDWSGAVESNVVKMTVDPASAGGSVAGSASVCSGTNNTVLSLSGYTGIIKKWQKSTDDWSTSTDISSTNTSMTATNLTVTTKYRVVVQSGVCLPDNSTDATVTVNQLPVPSISGPSPVCVNSTGNVYSTEQGMTAYTWSISAGGTITAGNGTNVITVTWNTAGLQSVSINYTDANGCTAINPSVYNVTVNNLPIPTLSGPATVCAGTAGNVYTTEQSMSANNWIVSAGGTITAGGTTTSNSVTVTWNTAGAQTVSINYTNANGCTAASPTVYPVTVKALPLPTVSGPVSVCNNSTGNVYTTETGMTGYTWSIVGGTITAGGTATSNTATVTWTSVGTQSISVNYTNANGCNASTATVYPVSVNALPTPNLLGPTPVCATTSGNVYTTDSFQGITNYVWSVSAGGTITAGGTASSNTATVTWNTAGTQSVSVNYTTLSGCTAASATTYPVTVNALPVPTITGPASVCATSTGNVYTTQPGMTGYSWSIVGGTITAGGTATSNTTTVTWTSSGAQSISVNYTNGNGCSAAAPTTYNVTVNALPVPVITGSATSCSGSTGNVYSTQAGMTGYTWSVSAGGSITSGAGTSAITVSWNTAGAQTVFVNYTNTGGCTATSPSIFNVVVNPIPVPGISGPPTACLNSTGNVYTTETGMFNYVWTVSAGGTITAGGTATSSFVTVTWNTVGANTVSVNYTSASGCTASTPTTINVTVSAMPVPTISGQSSGICPGAGWTTYTTESGNSNYTWTVSSGGSISGGQGTASADISWVTPGAQWVAVSYTNAAGCASIPTVLNVTVSSLPGPAGTITGTATLCAGTQGAAYFVAPIPNATYYNWTLPSGASIASGTGTNSITVNYAANAVSGSITVNGNNLCGNGSTSPPLQVTVNPLPATAGAISGLSSVCRGTSGVVYSVGSIANATGYVWTVPQGVVITSGANTRTITVTFTPIAQSGDFTVNGTNACGNGASSQYYVNILHPTPKPIIIIIINRPIGIGDILTSSLSEGNQWYLDGQPIEGANGQTLVIPSMGTYFIIAGNGVCPSDTSDYITVGSTGVDNKDNVSFVVYPVPNNGLFTASVNSKYADTYHILIYNTLGEMVYRTKDFKVLGKHEENIDLRNLPGGMYTLVFANDQTQVVRKVFINK